MQNHGHVAPSRRRESFCKHPVVQIPLRQELDPTRNDQAFVVHLAPISTPAWHHHTNHFETFELYLLGSCPDIHAPQVEGRPCQLRDMQCLYSFWLRLLIIYNIESESNNTPWTRTLRTPACRPQRPDRPREERGPTKRNPMPYIYIYIYIHSIYIYIYIHILKLILLIITCVYIYIYIYTHRERERERERDASGMQCPPCHWHGQLFEDQNLFGVLTCTEGTEELASTWWQRRFTPLPCLSSLPLWPWGTPVRNQVFLTKLGSLPCNVLRNFVVVLWPSSVGYAHLS